MHQNSIECEGNFKETQGSNKFSCVDLIFKSLTNGYDSLLKEYTVQSVITIQPHMFM